MMRSLRLLALAATATAALLASASLAAAQVCSRASSSFPAGADVYDYIVVGSGAGGGPLAANLAEAGYRVLLLEAGGDAGTKLNVTVPIYNGASTDDDELAWDYFVEHAASPAQQRDSKYQRSTSPLKTGILYPRAGTLGGCTQHNAMITLRAHDADWDDIGKLTGDSSWSADTMNRHWRRIERCLYRKNTPLIPSSKHHGYSGWFPTDQTHAESFLKSPDLTLASMLVGLPFEGRAGLPMNLLFDPNENGAVAAGKEGFHLQPLAIDEKGQRAGAWQRIKQVQARYPTRLIIKLHSLAQQVLLSDDNVAQGVRFQTGKHLYSADRQWRGPVDMTGVSESVAYARREVIVAAGAFNTPQLLMLSGIGDQKQLSQHGIKTRVNLPGVGTNLQDRYEVTVVSEMKHDFSILQRCNLDASVANPSQSRDECLIEWSQGKGPYASNGCLAAVVKRSTQAQQSPNPDLYVFALPAFFKGYYPQWFKYTKRHFTWAVLKGHTRNRAGSVELRSPNPREAPLINFRYWQEGGDADLQAMVEGVKLARRFADHKIIKLSIAKELVPGPAVQSDEQIKQFVRDEAWGHHACCTAPIGANNDPMAVLDSNFRVRGVQRLRVVDASIFPKIPGFFIALPIYLASEKASDSILSDARASGDCAKLVIPVTLEAAKDKAKPAATPAPAAKTAAAPAAAKPAAAATPAKASTSAASSSLRKVAQQQAVLQPVAPAASISSGKPQVARQ